MNRMKIIGMSLGKLMLGGVILFSLLGCLWSGKLIETSAVSSFYVAVGHDDAGQTILTLEGLVNASAMGVADIQVRPEGEALNVLVYTKLAGSRRTGTLSHRLTVPNKVTAVTFGADKTVIWTRQQGVNADFIR